MKKILLTYYQPGHCIGNNIPLVMTGLDTIIAKKIAYPKVPFIVNIGLMTYFGVNPDIYPNTPVGYGTTEEQETIRQAIVNMQSVGIEVIAYIFSGNFGRTIENMVQDIDNIIEIYPTIQGFFIDNYGISGGATKINQYCQHMNTVLDHPTILANSQTYYENDSLVGSYPNFPTHHIVYESQYNPTETLLAYRANLNHGHIDNLGVIPWGGTIEQLTDTYLTMASNYIGLFGFYAAPFIGYYINGAMIDRVATFLSEINAYPLSIKDSLGTRFIDSSQGVTEENQIRLKTVAGWKIGGKTIAKNDLLSGSIRIKTSLGVNSIKKL